MPSRKQTLDQVVAALETQFGPGVLRRAADVPRHVPHLPTGFAALDDLTGCGGLPLGAITLLTGPATSGKLTLAFKTLAAAQTAHPRQVVALVDLPHTADPDYLTRTGIDLARLLLVRPSVTPATPGLLVDLAATRRVRLVVVNSLSDLTQDRAVTHRLQADLGRLVHALRATQSALLLLDDPTAAWLRWLNLDAASRIRHFAALHLEMQLEQWLTRPDGELCGYQARAKLHKSRWATPGRTAALAVEFNGTVKARPTW